MGFCLFNNVAVAARHALDGWTSERVLVLDWDVHHGNGTNDIFYESDRGALRRASTSPRCIRARARLTDSGAGAGEGYTVNLPVPPGAGHAEWLGLVAARGRADRARVRAGPAARVGRVRRPPRRPAGELHADRGVLRGDGRGDARRSRATWTRRWASCWKAATTWTRWRASVAATIEGALDARRSPIGGASTARAARALAAAAHYAARVVAESAERRRLEPAKRRAPCKHGALAPR